MAVEISKGVKQLAERDGDPVVTVDPVDPAISDFAAEVARGKSPIDVPLKSAKQHISRAQRLLGLSE